MVTLFSGDRLDWNQIQEACDVEQIGSSAYAQIGMAEGHELESVRQIGRVLHDRHGLSLALISHFNGVQTRAFDGIVIDGDGQIVANFSLKHRNRFKVKESNRHLEHIGQIMAFSNANRWIEVAMKASGTPMRRPADMKPTYRFVSPEHRKHLAAY